MSFHVGQRVVCVDDKRRLKKADMSGLTRGQIYTVRWCGVHEFLPFWPETPSIRVEEIHRDQDPYDLRDPRLFDTPFRASRFRPVKETDISIFTAMLAPTPKQKVRA
jgi:hypothetical protein